MLYLNFTTYHENPRVALRAIQAGIIDQTYVIENLIQDRIAETLETIDAEEEHAESSWLQRCREELESLEVMATRPLPTTQLAKIEFVQDAYRYCEVGFGDILEIRDVSESRSPFSASPVDMALIDAALGHTRPSQADVRTAAFAVKPTLGKAECVYFPVYNDPSLSPTELCFVGKSVN